MKFCRPFPRQHNAPVQGASARAGARPLFAELRQDLDDLLLAVHHLAEEAVAVIPYNPLAGGLLTGKHDHKAPPPEGTRFTLGSAARRYTERYWNEREFDTIDPEFWNK